MNQFDDKYYREIRYGMGEFLGQPNLSYLVVEGATRGLLKTVFDQLKAKDENHVLDRFLSPQNQTWMFRPQHMGRINDSNNLIIWKIPNKGPWDDCQRKLEEINQILGSPHKKAIFVSSQRSMPAFVQRYARGRAMLLEVDEVDRSVNIHYILANGDQSANTALEKDFSRYLSLNYPRTLEWLRFFQHDSFHLTYFYSLISKKRNIFGVNPLCISVIYILLTLFLASALRKLVNAYTNSESLVKQFLLEFVATLELCAACFELIIVADNWGVGAYAWFLLLLTIWWSTKWGNASACPYCPLEEAFAGQRSWRSALNIIGIQLLAAIFTFRYVQVLWSMELVETHRDKAFEDCSADLQVDMIFGAMVECALTCMCRVVSKILGEKPFRFSGVVDAAFGTAMVVLAFNLSGGYFNPALATSLKFGCTGNTVLEHVVVYWGGACTGALLSSIIFESNAVQNFLKRSNKED